MRYIKGVVFSNTYATSYLNDAVKDSLMEMQKQSGCNTVVFVISAIQECVSDSKINYRHQFMPKDQNIITLIQYAKSIGLQTILKPEILCLDGNSQKEIASYHREEKEDSYWFQEYTSYIMHYAKVAEKADCDMFIIGCELVELERKESYWRNLICKIREEFTGFLTYNANRCNEANVMWWDALDYISANGFYCNKELQRQIERIGEIQKQYNKPFFFCEVGCKSCDGSAVHPEDWKRQGKVDLEEQAQYMNEFFNICKESKNLSGMVVYNWWKKERTNNEAQGDVSYNIYNKPVCNVLKQAWQEVNDEC